MSDHLLIIEYMNELLALPARLAGGASERSAPPATTWSTPTDVSAETPSLTIWIAFANARTQADRAAT
jgi:hypothetical protein